MTSMLPIWWQDAQPGQGRYQCQLADPYITVVYVARPESALCESPAQQLGGPDGDVRPELHHRGANR